MGITFEPYRPNACCLCGSSEVLTGEHKIKASALRAEFGADQMVIGRFDDPNEQMRPAQSVKSKALHFAARICGPCNNARTQAADREFDHFHKSASGVLAKGEDPKLIFTNERYAPGSEAYLNVFRYFAKLLCCHLAEVGAPRPRHMSRFAVGQATVNCVWLDVGEDWTYKQAYAESGPHKYASHGGLVVYGSKKTGGANAFHSTLTVGPLRYIFFSRLNWLERMELRFGHGKFYIWCRAQVRQSMNRPLPMKDRLKLGLPVDEPPDE
jgi:hypothetical protein